MKKNHINEFRAKDWYNLGENMINIKKRISCFKKAVALDPLHGPAWHYLGVLYNQQGELELEKFCNAKAEHAYKTGLQRYRRQITKDEWNTVIENKVDDELQAVNFPKETYDVMSVIDNEIDNLLENLGRLYCNMKELKRAEECYDKLIELYPNWAKPHKSRGWVNYWLDNNDKAIDDLRFVVEVDSSDYNSYYLLGKAYSEKGNIDRANWYFRKATNAADESSDSIEAKIIKADSSFELEDYDESLNAYQYILDKNPKNKEVWKKKAEVHLAKGENKEARHCFEKLCKIDERNNIKTDGGED